MLYGISSSVTRYAGGVDHSLDPGIEQSCRKQETEKIGRGRMWQNLQRPLALV
jgi:hypothetical protein